MHKKVIFIRKGLNLSKGKLVAQGSHASFGMRLNASKDVALDRLSEGGKKNVLYVKDEVEFLKIFQSTKSLNIPHRGRGPNGNSSRTKAAIGIDLFWERTWTGSADCS